MFNRSQYSATSTPSQVLFFNGFMYLKLKKKNTSFWRLRKSDEIISVLSKVEVNIQDVAAMQIINIKWRTLVKYLNVLRYKWLTLIMSTDQTECIMQYCIVIIIYIRESSGEQGKAWYCRAIRKSWRIQTYVGSNSQHFETIILVFMPAFIYYKTQSELTEMVKRVWNFWTFRRVIVLWK